MPIPVVDAADPERGNRVTGFAVLLHDNDDRPERDLRSPAGLWTSVLGKLGRKEDLAPEEAALAMSAILGGHATTAQIAGFALALRMKGETTAEIASLVRTLLHYAERLDVEGPLVDTAGTGGDGAGTVNVSTMAALIVAGAGVRVAKQGNRAASSRCGSADVLEALGVAIDLSPKGVARCIDAAGIGFCYAPRFHPAFRHAAQARRELGVATTFNFLGPLAHPARVSSQVLGVSDPGMAERLVAVLAELGRKRALVFHGHDGLDELTTTTTSSTVSGVHSVISPSSTPPWRSLPLASLSGSTRESRQQSAHWTTVTPRRGSKCLSGQARWRGKTSNTVKDVQSSHRGQRIRPEGVK